MSGLPQFKQDWIEKSRQEIVERNQRLAKASADAAAKRLIDKLSADCTVEDDGEVSNSDSAAPGDQVGDKRQKSMPPRTTPNLFGKAISSKTSFHRRPLPQNICGLVFIAAVVGLVMASAPLLIDQLPGELVVLYPIDTGFQNA